MKIRAIPKSLKLRAEQPNHSIMALLESTIGDNRDVVSQIDAALQKFGIEGTSGQEIINVCVECAKSVEMDNDGRWGNREGSEIFERFQGEGNFPLPKASSELEVEFEVTVSGRQVVDKGDYYTPTWKSDQVTECESANLSLFFVAARDDNSERAYQFDGETIWQGDVRHEINARLN